MTRQSIERGIAAIESEVARREQSGDLDPQFACYRSMAAYSDQQLSTGLAHYRRALDSGAWDIECRDGQLYFTSEKGQWLERTGSAFWKKRS